MERMTMDKDLATLDRLAKFPKGTPADPTKNMTPEQKAEWEAMNAEHRDKFKAASIYNGDALAALAEQAMDEKKKKTAYFSVFLPPGDTRWHSPSKTLTRGAFKSERDAHAWAKKNVPGYEYTVREFDDPEVIEKAMIDVARAVNEAREQGVRVRHQPAVGVREMLSEGVVVAERGYLYPRQPAFDRWVKSLRGVRLANGDMLQYFADHPEKLQEKQMRDKLALMDLDLTEESLPHLAIDRDFAALDEFSRVAAIDRAASSQIGKIIIEQMGGMRAMRMIGAKQIIWMPKGVRVMWPNKQRSKGNCFEVTLTPADLYDLEFFNVTIRAKKLVKRYRGVMGGQLAELFEQQTSWYLRMAAEQRARMAGGAEFFKVPLLGVAPFDMADHIKTAQRFLGSEYKTTSSSTIGDIAVLNVYSRPGVSVDAFVAALTPRINDLIQVLLRVGGKVALPLFRDLNREFTRVVKAQKKALSKRATGDEKDSKFEEGESADPTKNMSEEDATKWRLENLKNKDQFKDDKKDKKASGMYSQKFEHIVDEGEVLAQKFTEPRMTAQFRKTLYSALAHVQKFDQGQRQAPQADNAIQDINTLLNLLRKEKRKNPSLDVGSFPQLLLGFGNAMGIQAYDWGYQKPLSVKRWAADTLSTGDDAARLPDGWDSGHLEEDPAGTEPSEGSEIPDGDGNVGKRAGTVRVGPAAMYRHRWPFTYAHGAAEGVLGRDVVSFDQPPQLGTFPAVAVGSDGVKAQAVIFSWESRGLPAGLVVLKSDRAAIAEAQRDMARSDKAASDDKAARSGLYGFTKRVQADCEGCVRKVQKAAASIAKRAYGKNEKVAQFLTTHASRSDSLPAHILVAALGEMGPKVAADMKRAARLGELRDQRTASGDGNEDLRQKAEKAEKEAAPSPSGKAQVALMNYVSKWKTSGFVGSAYLSDISRDPSFRGTSFAKIMSAAEALDKKGLITFDGAKILRVSASDKTAARKGLYGFGDKVAGLGLQACTDVRADAGRIAYDLHRRRSAKHDRITSFLDQHSKVAECRYSKLLHASYPSADSKVAALIPPTTVAGWLGWEN